MDEAAVKRARQAQDRVLLMQAEGRASTKALAAAAGLWASIYANDLLDMAEGKR